ncbi:TonB-dependent receptor plug domain-containing protein [Amphibiibacter pelophylacis]|uniref:TonB-dependent receptor n=1 Tax=Amphibiibacter pelophylacis TaxID=1799477 RepID=A0ACC6P541_9BURK
MTQTRSRRPRVCGRTGVLGDCALTVLGALFFSATAQASESELLSLSLEDLLNVPISTASTYSQSQASAPANVIVLTAQDIRRYGWKDLADALRTVPGFQATSDRRYQYLGIRGMMPPKDVNSRVLILINGQRVNENIYGSAVLGGAFPLDLALVDRIEIIPGSGSAIYGGNAMFGIVNLITRTGRDFSGGEAEVTLGTHGRKSLRLSGGQASGDTEWVLSASGLHDRGGSYWLRDFRPDSMTPAASDAENWKRLFGQWSQGGWTAQLIHGNRLKHVPTGPDSSITGDPYNRDRDIYTLGQLQYERPLDNGWMTSRLFLGQFDFSNGRRDSFYPMLTEAVLGRRVDKYVDSEASGRWWGGDHRVLYTGFAHHSLLMGVEFQADTRQSFRMRDTLAARGIPIADEESTDATQGKRVGLYAQDEWKISERFSVTLGGRVDRYMAGDSRDATGFSPRLSAVYAYSTAQTFKLIYGTAYRPASPTEVKYNPVRPERVRNLEALWQHRYSPSAQGSLSLYHDVLSHPIEPDPSFDLVAKAGEDPSLNGAPVRVTGLEYSLLYNLPRRIDARLSYTWNRVRQAGQAPDRAPAQALKANLWVPFMERWWFSAEAQAVSASRAGQGTDRVAGHAIANLGLGYTHPGLGLTVQALLANAFDQRYNDPLSRPTSQVVGPENSVTRTQLPQDGRTWSLRLTKTF